MALKGKKKSRARGSQARRRPAAAPRPTYGGHEKARWYQTTQGIVIGFLVISTVIVFTWWFVANNRNESQALEDRQAALQSYTTELRTFIQDLTPLATEITGSASLNDEELAKQTKVWKDQLSAISVSNMLPPEELSAATGLIDVVMGLYGQSIEQFELVPTLEGNAHDEVSAKATASFLSANNVLTGVIGMVDTARADADLDPSGLTTPGTPQVQTAPSPGG